MKTSDGNIRYFEYAQDKFEPLSEYKSADPQRGVAFLPKRGINTHENEVMRAFKTVNDSYIEPISFIVPRRAEVFQDDIYPPVVGSKPAMSSNEWFDGKEGLPPKIDLASIYAGEEPAEIPAESKPPTKVPTSFIRPTTSPSKKEAEPAKEPVQSSSILRGPPPSMKEQTSSIAHLASKFTDEDELESDEDNSSFEEVPKPAERSERNLPRVKESVEPATIPRGFISQPIEPKPDNIPQASDFSALASKPLQTPSKVFSPMLVISSFPFPFSLPPSYETNSLTSPYQPKPRQHLQRQQQQQQYHHQLKAPPPTPPLLPPNPLPPLLLQHYRHLQPQLQFRATSKKSKPYWNSKPKP